MTAPHAAVLASLHAMSGKDLSPDAARTYPTDDGMAAAVQVSRESRAEDVLPPRPRHATTWAELEDQS